MIVLVIGSGLTGATAARVLAEEGHDVLVFEERAHLGGNVYTESKGNYYEHTYGPHIFHTSSQAVISWVQRFTEWIPYVYAPKAFVFCGNTYKFVDFPITEKTIKQLWPNEDLERQKNKIRKDINAAKMFVQPENLEQQWLCKVGWTLYEIFFHRYSTIQWGVSPSKLLPVLGHRVPFTLDNVKPNYFPNDTFQALPKRGYTELIEKMLNHRKIEICAEAWEPSSFDASKFKIIYTGQLDRYHNYCHGHLPYRSLKWDTARSIVNKGAVVNLCDDHTSSGVTRIISDGLFMGVNSPERHEIPLTYQPNCGMIPMYPMPTREAQDMANMYRKIKVPNVYFGGRLGSYKYINMDAAILEGHKLAHSVYHEENPDA